jgi:hypothetical protein
MPYSVTINEHVVTTLRAWAFPKTMLDRIVHHLTHVLPASPDDHLGPPLLTRPNECYCPLTFQDERAGREGQRINCQFTVERSNPPPTLRVFHVAVTEERAP